MVTVISCMALHMESILDPRQTGAVEAGDVECGWNVMVKDVCLACVFYWNHRANNWLFLGKIGCTQSWFFLQTNLFSILRGQSTASMPWCLCVALFHWMLCWNVSWWKAALWSLKSGITTYWLRCSCGISPLLLYFSYITVLTGLSPSVCDQVHANVSEEVFILDSSRPGGSSLCCSVVLCSQMNGTVASISEQKLYDRDHATHAPSTADLEKVLFKLLHLSFSICKALLASSHGNLSGQSVI